MRTISDFSHFSQQYMTQAKYNICRELVSHYMPPIERTGYNATCLKHTQLISYYNELVIQLKIAKHIVNTSISKEIQENYRVEVEIKERNIIKLLQESILPLLDTAVSSYIIIVSIHYYYVIMLI